MNSEDVFGPRKVKIVDVLINSAGAFISGVIGSVLLIFIVFLISGLIDIPGKFKKLDVGIGGDNPLFPLILSFITFIVTVTVSIITYYFLSLTEPTKYKRTIIHLSQVSFFSILTYVFLSPLYIYSGMQSYDNITYIFVIHVLILNFGMAVILEIMNNYRYVLVGVYASFVGLFITLFITFLVFSMFSTGYARLLSLLLILPLTNGLTMFFKGLFEMIYHKYFILTSKDPLGDIFRRIEQEEINEYNEIANENSTY